MAIRKTTKRQRHKELGCFNWRTRDRESRRRTLNDSGNSGLIECVHRLCGWADQPWANAHSFLCVHFGQSMYSANGSPYHWVHGGKDAHSNHFLCSSHQRTNMSHDERVCGPWREWHDLVSTLITTNRYSGVHIPNIFLDPLPPTFYMHSTIWLRYCHHRNAHNIQHENKQ